MIELIKGDCIESLKKLEDESINTCITSPPYWGLRNYNDEEKQLGMEDMPEEFVDNLVKVFREVKRVLRDDGTVWLNLGDSYAMSSIRGGTKKFSGNVGSHNHYEKSIKKGKRNIPIGLKPKDLIGIPWRVAFALQQDGWYLRQDIIWNKPNPMPESVKDRCTKAHEYIFLLSKSPKYYYDNEAIKDDAKFPDGPTAADAIRKGVGDPKMQTRNGLHKIGANPKRNKRSVWAVTTKPFTGAHFATFPMDLIEPCVLAGCPEKVCVKCGEPYQREVELGDYDLEHQKLSGGDTEGKYFGASTKDYAQNKAQDASETKKRILESMRHRKDLGVVKQCDCETDETRPGVVLDPFAGSGTTAVVASGHNRDAVLLELNEEYIELAIDRIKRSFGMFTNIKYND